MRLLGTILFFNVWLIVVGQFVNDGSTITIANDATLFINGDVQSNGIVVNKGTINLKGDWQNNDEYLSEGRFVLSGANQNIYHNGRDFGSLVVDGNVGGIKKIDTSCNVRDSLILRTGYLHPDSNTYLMLEDGAFVSTGSSLSFVEGRLFHKGTGTKYFPIGKNAQFLPAEFHEIEGSNITIGMEAYSSIPQNISYGEGAEKITVNNYWEKIMYSGSLTSAYIALPYEDLILDKGRIFNIFQADTDTGMYRGIGGSYDFDSRLTGDFIISTDFAQKRYFSVGQSILAPWELLYIPNALSQHASGDEDQVVKVYGDVFVKEGFLFSVVNQWGNKVFETTSLDKMMNEGWDGINEKTGKRETTGQYHYIIKATGKDGIAYKNAGAIWVID